jgi:hypothetical protein
MAFTVAAMVARCSSMADANSSGPPTLITWRVTASMMLLNASEMIRPNIADPLLRANAPVLTCPVGIDDNVLRHETHFRRATSERPTHATVVESSQISYPTGTKAFDGFRPLVVQSRQGGRGELGQRRASPPGVRPFPNRLSLSKSLEGFVGVGSQSWRLEVATTPRRLSLSKCGACDTLALANVRLPERPGSNMEATGRTSWSTVRRIHRTTLSV